MKTTELRVGINIFVDGTEKKISESMLIKILHSSPALIDPIRITKERLIQFGFSKVKMPELDKNCWIKQSGAMKIIIAGVGFWDVYSIYDPIGGTDKLNFICSNSGLTYIHQLQTLWFVLTGHEIV